MRVAFFLQAGIKQLCQQHARQQPAYVRGMVKVGGEENGRKVQQNVQPYAGEQRFPFAGLQEAVEGQGDDKAA